MTPPQSRGSTPAKSEHPNTNEAEENDLKNTIMKIIEFLKEKMRKGRKVKQRGKKLSCDFY